MHKKILSFLFLPLILGFATRANAPVYTSMGRADFSLPAPELLHAIHTLDTFIENAIQTGQTPGAAVAIVADGKVLLAKGYGKRAVADDLDTDVHTAFRLASLSKSFAAFLTGRLVEKERLNWNDPVVQHLPDFCLLSDEQTRALQLTHLLSHTTGLPYHTYTNLIEAGKTTEEIIPLLGEVELIGEVGTIYSYQNAAFSLIEVVAEAVTGLNYEDNLEREVFEPLRMRDASASLEELLLHGNAAMPHKGGNGLWRQFNPSSKYYNAGPAGGINASASDMAQYLLAMLGNRPDLMGSANLRKIGSPYIHTPVRWKYFRHWKQLEKAHYGLGWRILRLTDGESLLYHGGHVAGYRAEMAVHPEEGWGICVLFNSAPSIANQCVPLFMDALEKKKEIL